MARDGRAIDPRGIERENRPWLSLTSVFSLLLSCSAREPRIPDASVGGKVHLG